MSRVGTILLSVALLAGTHTAARGQTESPIDQVLRQAQQYLDALDYARAEALARQLLEGTNTGSPAQRQRARLILASAYYPEDFPDKRRRADALNILKQAVRSDINLTIDRNLTWAGLDSILAEAKRTTFGMELRGDAEQVVTGQEGTAAVRVRATRPAKFRLVVTPAAGGAVIAMDSIANATEGVLRFKTMANGRPAFTTGEYLLTVTAIDQRGADSVTTSETATITSPPLDLTPIPNTIDSTKLLPERSKKVGAKGIIHAIWVGAGVYAVSNLLTADSTQTAKFGPDSKGIPIAALVSGTVLAVSFADPGRKLPANVALNKQVQEDLGKRITAVTAENQLKINAYRTTVAMKGAAR